MLTFSIILGLLMAGFGTYYARFLATISDGLRQLQRQARSTQKPMISVIVAARNEETHIASCIDSLRQQTYPAGLYEVLISDDGSTDETLLKAREATQGGIAFKVLPSPGGKALGKAAAIARGIDAARGSIILTTDADCTVLPTWISSIASFFTADVVFVAGPVLEPDRSSLFSKLESLDFFGIITAGAGLIGAGRPIMCNGANMGFRRSAYESVGGYGADPSMNDDEALLNRIVVRKLGRIAYASEPQSIVRTRSANTPWKFFLQRLRWAGKQGRYEDLGILQTLVLVYLFFATTLISVFVGIWTTWLLAFACLILIIKAAIERSILNAHGTILGIKIDRTSFVIAEIFHVPYIAITAALGQFVKARWK
jgi:cellulose synthase/poly-beta-1,6-N-acetylglucosamine synthase-like glycosyltransferase